MSIFSYLHPGRHPFTRFIYAMLLVFGTYNFTGISVGHWLYAQAQVLPQNWPIFGAIFVATLMLWAFFLRSARQSVPIFMSLAGAVFLGLIGYSLIYVEWLNPTFTVIMNLIQVGLALHIGASLLYGTAQFNMNATRRVIVAEQPHHDYAGQIHVTETSADAHHQ